MTRKRIGLVLALFLSLVAAPGFCAKKIMVVLQQTHRLYGRATVYLAPDAVKVACNDRAISFLAAAPKWDVLTYHDGRKVIHTFPFAQWSKNGLKTALVGLEDNDRFKTQTPVPAPDAMYAGVKAQVLAFQPRSHGHGRIGDLWVATTLPVSPDACRALCAIWDIRDTDGVPLRFRAVKGTNFVVSNYGSLNDDHVVEELKTSKVDKLPYDPKVFAAPKGYKEVMDGKIFIGSQDEQELQEIMGK
ncbi:MAG TPA: hypothetical protein V6C81_26555 [Planktothrix sp.]|jgi:hypothetical protein